MAKDKEVRINIGGDEEESTDQAETTAEPEPEETASTDEQAREPEVETPKPELTEEEKLAARVAELEDKLLRAQAELDNSRKRSARMVEDMLRTANDRLLSELLDVVDNFERALQHSGDNSSPEALGQGMEMIYKQLVTILERYDVRPIEAVGQAFDPNLHEALMQIASEEHDEGTVAEEISKGYKIGPRVLRHSKVAVSRGKPNEAEETEGQNEAE
ncbi:MAG: nucleotide exchange factor GrpE [Candidatus Zixiibacteriota bacterium]|nr:MAG: nucleotide exchange factor GrpE [candidate division Zixibacteria bacterium]